MDVREVTDGDWALLEERSPRDAATLRAQAAGSDGRRVTVLIAWEGGAPLGSGAVQWDGPVGAQARAAHPQAVEINHLHVHEQARGRGVGTALIVAAERLIAADGRELVAVGVAEDNPRARALYERLGYEPTDLVETSRYRFQDADGEWHDAVEHDRTLLKRLTE